MPTTYTMNPKMTGVSARVERNAITYTKEYIVTASERVEAPALVDWITTTSPYTTDFVIGTSALSGATNAKLNDWNVEPLGDGRTKWRVVATYSTIRGSGATSTNPFSRPVDIQYGSQIFSAPIFKDYSATPQEIVNTAGSPFDELPQAERALLTLTYTRNETVSFFTTTVLPAIANYGVVVNSASFTCAGVTWPALYAKLSIPSSTFIIEGSTSYYRTSYQFVFREGQPGYASDGWRERYLSRGYFELIPPENADWPIRDVDGQIVSKPWPLDASGAALPTRTSAPAVCGPFSLYKEIAFSVFSFT